MMLIFIDWVEARVNKVFLSVGEKEEEEEALLLLHVLMHVHVWGCDWSLTW